MGGMDIDDIVSSRDRTARGILEGNNDLVDILDRQLARCRIARIKWQI
jgi:hypothetical protein